MFEIPTDLTALDDDALATSVEQAQAAYDELMENRDSLTDEQLDQMDALVAFITTTVPTEQSAREETAAARQARIDAAAAAMEAPAEPAEGEGEPEAEAEPVEPPVEGEPEALAASAGRRRAGVPMPPARRQPAPAREGEGQFLSLVASAGLNGIEAGSSLATMSDAADIFIERMRGVEGGTSRQKLPAVSIRRDFSARGGLHTSNPDFASFQELAREAARETRLSGGSLVAAGGWCAPSENDYSLRALETLDGIIDVPEVGVSRGGKNYTPGPDFSDIFATAGFRQTEAQAIAGTTKNCVEIDCPDFEEVRLDAVGICVTAPLLTRAAYPEAVERWLTGTTIANEHKVAGSVIATMRALLGTVIAPTLTGTPVTWGLLTALELVIEGQRQAYRLSENDTLEVILPRWAKVAIRADLANRAFVGASSVSDQQMMQHFIDRKCAVQFVLNYQELANPKTIAAFPNTVEALIYPAGTFVKGVADVINVSTLYDLDQLTHNSYTAAFVEDGVLVAKMQHGGARVQVPVNVTGMMGALQLDDTWGTAQVENAGAAAA